jgi:NADPH-dependent 2,4-dienoyl-CoA reductase/sulfur reductase-like enzyme
MQVLVIGAGVIGLAAARAAALAGHEVVVAEAANAIGVDPETTLFDARR